MIIDATKHVHGHTLQKKCMQTKDAELTQVFSYYRRFREIVDELIVDKEDVVVKLVEAANDYRSHAIYILESRDNSGQEVMRSTILEEFFYHLFNGLVRKYTDASNVVIGKANSYVSLSFTPRSFSKMFENPEPYIHTKDQDFLLGCPISLQVVPQGIDDRDCQVKIVTIPALAIECKTYLERNMLDSCAATARRLKQAMPYCLYIVASEYLKMSDEVSPEITDIDEVYILCKAANVERDKLKQAKKPPHPIDSDLVVDLFNRVYRHFNSLWWEPAKALERGKIIGRP